VPSPIAKASGLKVQCSDPDDYIEFLIVVEVCDGDADGKLAGVIAPVPKASISVAQQQIDHARLLFFESRDSPRSVRLVSR